MHNMEAHKSYDSSSLLHFEANTFTLQDLGSSCWYVDVYCNYGVSREDSSVVGKLLKTSSSMCVHGAHKHTCIIHTKMHATKAMVCGNFECLRKRLIAISS